MKKIYIGLLIIALVLAGVTASFIVRSHISSEDIDEDEAEYELEADPDDLTESDDYELEERDEGSGIAFDEEGDGAVVETVEKDVSAFYGKWEATSDMGLYLYGSIDINVKEGGTWSGEITGERLRGTWEDKGDHLHMNNDIFSFDLAFSDSGNLVMIDTDSDDVIYTVLTKKK